MLGVDDFFRLPAVILVYASFVSSLTSGLKLKSDVKIKKVHIVSMNHLDVGYYDGLDKDVGFAVQVLNRYQTEYFVRAMNLSWSLIEKGFTERFVYTTHPWLVSLYLDCPRITLVKTPLKCPSPKEQEMFKKAVREGLIAWHAFPMNIQTDFMGEALAAYAVSLGRQLDARFGIKRTHATMSQRDIPGITKALVPVLLRNGVKAISVGVNPGTAPPAVPSPFVWKFSADDTDGILAFWDKGGYPINPGPDPAHPRGLARDKCVTAPGLEEALCFAFRTDNTGPPVSIEEWLGYYEILRAEFPDAELVASTFDLFVAALEKVKDSLPVVSSEIGDTWVQGDATDPKKVAMYRAFVQAWERCTASGKCLTSDPRIQAMLRFLVKLPEHTWGAHDFLDHTHWTNQELARARTTKPYMQAEDSWREQRQFLDFALQALGGHPLKDMVLAEYSQLQAKMPDFTGYTPAKIGDTFECPNGVQLKFGADGSLVRLFDPFNKREWASPSSPLGRLTYDTYIEKDFIDMAKLYNYEAGVGYDKPNVTRYAHPDRRRWEMTALAVYKKVSSSACDLWVKVVTKDNQTRVKYGAPKAFYVRYTTSVASKDVNVTVLMLGKTTTRLPESISYGHSPVTAPGLREQDDLRWTLNKMGRKVDPCDVVLNGSQYVHGVDTGVNLLGQSGKGLQLLSRDVPIVFIGTDDHVDSPFPVPLQPLKCGPVKIRTMSFNIYNNIWNTNFIYWYPYNKEDTDFKARFTIRFKG